MKFLLVLSAVLAAAYAEAEAEAAPYHYGGWPYAYHGLPVVKAAEEPAEDAEKKVVPLTYGYPWAHSAYAAPWAPYYHPYYAPYVPAVKAEEKTMEKREAEAEADPEAWWYGNFYNGWYGHHAAYRAYHHYPYGYGFYNLGGCRNNYGALVPCA